MLRVDNLDVSKLVNHIISITDLARGKATKVLNTVVKEKVPYLIFKNNKPQAALIDIEVYNDLIQTKKKYDEMMIEEYLLGIAEGRIEKHDPSKTKDFEEVLKKYNIAMADLDAVADKVEIE